MLIKKKVLTIVNRLVNMTFGALPRNSPCSCTVPRMNEIALLCYVQKRFHALALLIAPSELMLPLLRDLLASAHESEFHRLTVTTLYVPARWGTYCTLHLERTVAHHWPSAKKAYLGKLGSVAED